MDIKKYQKLYTNCKAVKTSFLVLMVRSIYYKFFYKKNILASSNTIVSGLSNIQTNGILKIGLMTIGFTNKKDTTYLNIKGKLILKGNYSIAKGCRIEVGPDATLTIGENGYVNAFSKMIIIHKLEIGDNCSISWDTQFLDDDFHEIEYDGKKPQKYGGIKVGNNVWIGCNCFIYKGAEIPDGCIVASNSVVKGKLTEKNVLLAGNPAVIIKRNVSWK